MKSYIERRNGILYFDGVNTLELADKFGTPLYVMSETAILNKIEELRESFLDKYPKTRVAYASKAFSTLAMMKLCNREGLSVDVVSGGELFMARSAGIPGERIEFNGNNKTPEEIREALDYGVGRIIVDGLTELDLIEKTVRDMKLDAKVPVMFRITPGIKADTHDHLVTGKKDSKFGIPLDDEIFFPLVEQAVNSSELEFMGLHWHIGSQLFEVEPYLAALEIGLSKVKEIRDRFGVTVRELNLGGGFGIDRGVPYSFFLDPLMERIDEFFGELGEERPSVVIEPGRSLVGEAGITLYRIGQIKDIPGLRKFISVDGGMGDNIRPALYQAEYHAELAGRTCGVNSIVTISGKYCETGDILIKDIELPRVETGDVLAVFSTGAYNYSMASNYNLNLTPAVVFCKDGDAKLAVRRESYENLLENQIDI